MICVHAVQIYFACKYESIFCCTFPLLAPTPPNFRTGRKTLSVKRFILMAWFPPSAVSCLEKKKLNVKN